MMKYLILILFLFCALQVNADELVTYEKEIIVWETVSRTYPAYSNPYISIYRPPTCNEIGRKFKVTIGKIEWKGRTIEIELERVEVRDGEKLERSVSCPDSNYPGIIYNQKDNSWRSNP